MSSLRAVVFDFDGVLADTETIWSDVRRTVAESYGGRWNPDSQQTMMGMSTAEWTHYMIRELDVRLSPGELADLVIRSLEENYALDPPWVADAGPVVAALAARWPLALASSSPRRLLRTALSAAGLRADFTVVVSSEQVQRGKPAPDVFLFAAQRLGVPANHCVAVEDSRAGILAAQAAGMPVIAVPNRSFPPDDNALRASSVVVPELSRITPEVVVAAHSSHCGA